MGGAHNISSLVHVASPMRSQHPTSPELIPGGGPSKLLPCSCIRDARSIAFESGPSEEWRVTSGPGQECLHLRTCAHPFTSPPTAPAFQPRCLLRLSHYYVFLHSKFRSTSQSSSPLLAQLGIHPQDLKPRSGQRHVVIASDPLTNAPPPSYVSATPHCVDAGYTSAAS